ncbi:MAG TPA: DNA repair protein RecO [Solimonas sp.]|nr:DNA repair protein RecO [Solimonas sp.]
MKVRVSLAPAYLLSSRPYSDSSLLLEVFTREQGRVGLVARGARSARSRWRGLLQPFLPLLLSWQQQGELGSLTGAEGAGPATSLGGERVFYGWYLNELLLRLLQRQDPHPDLFAHYAISLDRLAGVDFEAGLRIFEKHLLAEIGYGLLLPASLDPMLSYRYDWEQGPAPSASGEGYAGADLIALREERLGTPDSRRAARALLQAALQRQLGNRPLETPQLLRALRKQTSA